MSPMHLDAHYSSSMKFSHLTWHIFSTLGPISSVGILLPVIAVCAPSATTTERDCRFAMWFPFMAYDSTISSGLIFSPVFVSFRLSFSMWDFTHDALRTSLRHATTYFLLLSSPLCSELLSQFMNFIRIAMSYRFCNL
jgi:hypothetical protein